MNVGSIEHTQACFGTNDRTTNESNVSMEYIDSTADQHVDSYFLPLMNDALHDFEFNEADVDALMEL